MLPTPQINFLSRIRQNWRALIQPHPQITEIEESRKAELLSTITIIVTVFLITGILAGVDNVEIFIVLLCISLSAYLFSRTTHHRLGVYLFTYTFTAIGFITIYRGTATSVDIAVASIVHIAIIFSSVLLSQRGFLVLVILATVVTFAAPSYSTIPLQETDSFARTGGMVLTIGMLLYGINNFRASLEKEQLKRLSDANLKLEDLTTSLEERITERTQELQEASKQIQQRALRLQDISDISQEIVSNVTQKPDEVLRSITQVISRKLGYYHVGIFLLDKDGEFAVLRAANSRGGQIMLTRRHQLKVGATGIVGYVTQSGRPRIALDTSTDVVFFNNPDLPETRSEIALPLKYGDTIFGAMDVQSTLPSAFNEEDVDTLSALANQVAIVVKNLQIIEDNKYDLREKPIGFFRSTSQSSYSFQPDGSIVVAKLPENDPALEKIIASGETVILTPSPKHPQSTLAVPVKFREQLVGVIHIETSEGKRNWTEDEIALVQAIADRAAFALENARLLEDSQKRASKEQAIGDIASKIGASVDIESILRTAVRELGAQISGTQVTVEIGGGKN